MTYIIAEAGSNHDCNFETAKKLVDIAKNSGADAVKFQIFSAETLYSSKTEDFDKYKNVWNLIKSLEVSFDFFKDIKKYCDDCGIQFLATPFSKDAVDLLCEMEVPVIKIASFEFTDALLVSYIAKTQKPIIASTGLCSEKDIKQFLEMTPNNDITLLHCNSAYPTPDVDANLKSMTTLQKMSKCKVGLSDHTMGILAPVIAVSLGASVIEKHFTISRNNVGPDHPFSIEPNELKSMVSQIRQAEILLGDGKMKRTPSEESMFYARRSVIASKDIKKGELFTVENITTKRPGSGLSASRYLEIIGKTSSRNIESDDILQESDVV